MRKTRTSPARWLIWEGTVETLSPVLLTWVARERLGLTSLGLVVSQMALGHRNRRKDPTGWLLLRGSKAMTLLLVYFFYIFIYFFIPLQPQRRECDGVSPARIARGVFWDQEAWAQPQRCHFISCVTLRNPPGEGSVSLSLLGGRR